MVALPQQTDATLELSDRALERAENGKPPRPYLGMSAIGASCSRALWYSFRWASPRNFDAATLKRFADGHATEAVAVQRLRMADGIELHDVIEGTTQQFGYRDHSGHFRGHMDGVILGIAQAPKTWHVLEIKAVADDKFRAFERAKLKFGDKQALREWNPVYYAQAVLYMDYADLDRHYTVVCTPGCRRWTSVRTNADKAEAQRLKDRARSIIESDGPPDGISDNPDYFECKWCEHSTICHEKKLPQSNCRTCLHASPVAGGDWHCGRFGRLVSNSDQLAGCPAHLFIPALVDGDQVDAGDDWVEYQMPDGTLWRDGGSQ